MLRAGVRAKSVATISERKSAMIDIVLTEDCKCWEACLDKPARLIKVIEIGSFKK
jgi:hypothetical protein